MIDAPTRRQVFTVPRCAGGSTARPLGRSGTVLRREPNIPVQRLHSPDCQATDATRWAAVAVSGDAGPAAWHLAVSVDTFKYAIG